MWLTPRRASFVCRVLLLVHLWQFHSGSKELSVGRKLRSRNNKKWCSNSFSILKETVADSLFISVDISLKLSYVIYLHPTVKVTTHNLKMWFFSYNLRNLAEQRRISSIWECYKGYISCTLYRCYFIELCMCVWGCTCEECRCPLYPELGIRLRHWSWSHRQLWAWHECWELTSVREVWALNNGAIFPATSFRSKRITLSCLLHGRKIHVLFNMSPRPLSNFMFNSHGKTQNEKLSFIVLEPCRALIPLSVLPARRLFPKRIIQKLF